MKHVIEIIIIAFMLLSTSSIAAINKAPSIHLPTIDGEVDIKQLQGKIIYLDFWASWCGPCRNSFPWMAEMKERYGAQGLEIVAVNLDNERALADEFLDDMDVNFIVAFDASGESAEKYELRVMPSSYLIGRDGSVQAKHVGFRDKDKKKIEAAINNMLQQQ